MKAFLTPDELAERWETSRSTIYRKVAAGEPMPQHMRLNDGPRARLRFRITDIEKWEDQHSSAPSVAPERPLPVGTTLAPVLH